MSADEPFCRRHHVAQADLRRRLFEVRVGKERREPLPCFDPLRFGPGHAVDAQECDAAENERCNGGRQIEALGNAARRHRAISFEAGADVGQRMAADGVDGRCPSLLLQGLARL